MASPLLPTPPSLAHSPPSSKTSSTLSSFVNSPTAVPPATQIFLSAGGIPSLNKGLLDEGATILSHPVTHSRNILWGFIYSELILEDTRERNGGAEDITIPIYKGDITGMCSQRGTFLQRGCLSIQENR